MTDDDDDEEPETESATPQTPKSTTKNAIFDVVEGQLSDQKNILQLIFKVIEDEKECPTLNKAM